MSGWSEQLPALCAADGEFALLARYWTGSLRLGFGADAVVLTMVDGAVTAASRVPAEEATAPDEPGHVGVAAPGEMWDQILAPVPPPFCNDIVPAQALGVRVTGHDLTFWQYYPAIRRLVELLRAERTAVAGAA